MKNRLLFEKTPAYFDRASPQLVACAVPSARLLVMLRNPADRARSAYSMCQREMGKPWCTPPFEEALKRVFIGNWGDASALANASAAPRVSRSALRREPHLRRMIHMGQYATFLRRWLDVFTPSRLRVLWLEQFKRDPFACMLEVERFSGLSHHPYRSFATRNAAGLWVVGKSKSSSAATSSDAAAAAAAAAAKSPLPSSSSRNTALPSHQALLLLRAYYAPWQRRLRELLVVTNTSLLPLDSSALSSVF